MRIRKFKKKEAAMAVICILALMIGLSACGNNNEPESISNEELELRHSELITVEDVQWPEGEQNTATVSVSFPSLYDAYQMACSDPEYNGENSIELMYSYLEDTVTMSQMSVPAVMTDGEWTLDEVAMDRLVQEQIGLDTNAFLEAALADLEPLEIELEWGETE